MIPSYRLLATFLLILLPFSSSQSTPPPSIALNEKEGDNYLFRESCLVSGTSPDRLEQKTKYSADVKCDVLIHTRKRGLEKLLVEIEIQYISSISGSTKLDPTKPISIKQGSLSVECRSDGVEAASNSDDFTIGPNPIVYFTNDRLYCSFVLITEGDTFSKPATPPIPSLVLKFHHETNEESLTYLKLLWEGGRSFCDIVDTFEQEDSEFSLKKAEIVDGESIGCLQGPPTGIFIEKDSSLRLVNSIACKDGMWISKISQPSIKEEKISSFRVACGIRICSQCTETALTELHCGTCSKVEFFNRFDECAQIKCLSNKWIFENDKWMNHPRIKCVKNSNESYGWTANGIEVKEGACTSNFDCITHSQLKLTCNSKKGLCRNVTLSADRMTISCNETNFFFLGYGNSTLRPERTLECNETTGIFKDIQGLNDVPTRQTIGCYKVKRKNDRRKSSSASSQTATGSIPLYSWLPIVVIAILLCIGGVLIFFFMKRRQSMEETAADETDQPSKEQSPVKETETDGISNTNRAAVVRDSSRVKLTKADSEIVKDQKIIKSESERSEKEFEIEMKTETEATSESEKSTKSTKSRTTGQVNIVPSYHFKRELNKNLVAPSIEPYVITKKNMIPAPRNSKNCPDWYSTGMDVPNPRLRERAKTVSTNVNQQSRVTTGDGTTTNQQSGTTADGTTTTNQQTGTTVDGTTTGNHQTGTTADATTTNQQSGATQSGASGANSSSENKKSV